MTTEVQKHLSDYGITPEEAEYYQLMAKYAKEIDAFIQQFMANPENEDHDRPTEADIKAELQRLEAIEKRQSRYGPYTPTLGIEIDSGEEERELDELIAKYPDALQDFLKRNTDNDHYPTLEEVRVEIQRLEELQKVSAEKNEIPVQESHPNEAPAPVIKTESESKNNSQNIKTKATLNRQTFTFSRELEYFTERELTTQIGYSKNRWLPVILKELLDNALDACEDARVEPDITVGICDGTTLYVKDNAGGIPAETIAKILDFSTRTSDKQAYRSPSRGAQGNALKTILAIPFILSGNKISRMVIESKGIRHNIEVTVDAIEGKPKITDTQEEIVKTNGTTIWVNTSLQLTTFQSEFLQIVCDFQFFSPHVTMRTHGFLTDDSDDEATVLLSEWKKFLPSDATSAHWYSLEDFKKLICAYIAKARANNVQSPTVREFVKEFDGLTSTAKQKSITAILPKNINRLSDLVVNGELNENLVSSLLFAMKSESRPVTPENLGIIGEKHFQRCSTVPIKYRAFKHKGPVPFVVEASFVEGDDDFKGLGLTCSFGCNFSPNFRGFDPFGDTQFTNDDDRWCYGIHGLIESLHLNSDDDAELILHIAHPAISFTDKAKKTIWPDAELRNAVQTVIKSVLKEHCEVWEKADREAKAHARHERQQEKAAETKTMSLKDAVFKVIPDAVAHVSTDGKFEFEERQLFYRVHDLIQEYTDETLNINYFNPPLLTQYEEEFGEIPGLLFYGRGHFKEPYRNIEFEIGTSNVNKYTMPDYEFDKIFVIEKGGFAPILQSAQLGKKYDMVIVDNKGFPVRACKRLLAQATSKNITIVTAHDCDIAGHEIGRCLAEQTRTTRGLIVKTIDIGLTVADGLAMGLRPEPIKLLKHDIPLKLKERLTPEELNFLKSYRIELNAMTSGQLIGWIESNLQKLGLAKKLIPPADILDNEISINLDEDRNVRVAQVVREKLKQLESTLMF